MPPPEREQEIASIPEITVASATHLPHVDELVQIEQDVGEVDCSDRFAISSHADARLAFASADASARSGTPSSICVVGSLAGRPPRDPRTAAPATARTRSLSSVSACVGTVETLRAPAVTFMSGRSKTCRTSGTAARACGRRRRFAASRGALRRVLPDAAELDPRGCRRRCGKIGGPPIVRLMVPPATRMLSRTISASSRCGRYRHRYAILGSFAALPASLERRRHLVGLRRHHQPVHLLDAPAAVHEFHGQPVEQLPDASAARPSCRSCRAWRRCRARNGAARCD